MAQQVTKTTMISGSALHTPAAHLHSARKDGYSGSREMCMDTYPSESTHQTGPSMIGNSRQNIRQTPSSRYSHLSVLNSFSSSFIRLLLKHPRYPPVLRRFSIASPLAFAGNSIIFHKIIQSTPHQRSNPAAIWPQISAVTAADQICIVTNDTHNALILYCQRTILSTADLTAGHKFTIIIP